jgi:hypothetical protein
MQRIVQGGRFVSSCDRSIVGEPFDLAQGRRGHRAVPFALATLADFCEQLAGLGIDARLEADAKRTFVHVPHLGLFVRTPIKRKL